MSADIFPVIEQLFGQLKRQTQAYQSTILGTQPSQAIDAVQLIKKSADNHGFAFGGYVDLSYATAETLKKFIIDCLHSTTDQAPIVVILDATNHPIDEAVYAFYQKLMNTESVETIYDTAAPNRIAPIPGFGIAPTNWLSVIALEAV